MKKFIIPLLLLIPILTFTPEQKNDLNITKVVLEKPQEPEETKKTQMLYFGATWCPPCNKMKQLFKDPEVKKELDRLDFRMYDQAKDKPMFKKFNITLYPTTIFQAEGAITVRYTGYIPKKDLLEILRSIKD
tara:strand:+ start:11833 stop:12228 length:396 start_codon:yes stop_codon:yes gene_type:complete